MSNDYEKFAYEKVLQKVLKYGTWEEQRAVDKEGKPLKCLSLFGVFTRFHLKSGFPIITTRKVYFKTMVKELLWFISGSTNVKPLQEQGVHIWDNWADEDGNLGSVYGKHWRAWDTSNGPHDQLKGLIKKIRDVKLNKRSPHGRRLLLLSYNPGDMPSDSVPVGCHTLAQFKVNHSSNDLSCQVYQRSADVFIGLPYNIMQYALLTHILAGICGLNVGHMLFSIGDAHIYENHYSLASEQVKRKPYKAPELVIHPIVESIDNLQPNQFHLVNYQHHPELKGEIAK